MHDRREFVDYVVELLGPFGTVSARRMFGGHGIHLDGLLFAIVVDEALWFKADDISRAEFEAAGCDRFSYARGGRLTSMGFYRAPADAMESPAEALPWARTAYAAALRANAKRVADEARRAAAAAAAAATAPAAAPKKRTRTTPTAAGQRAKPGARAASRPTARAACKTAATGRATRTRRR